MVIAAILLVVSRPAFADHHVNGIAGEDFYEISGEKAVDGDAENAAGVFTSTSGEDSADPSPYVDYRWLPSCFTDPAHAGSSGVTDQCGAALSCPDPTDVRYRLWGQLAEGTWIPLSQRCFGDVPTAKETPKPQVTPGLVLDALRRVGLPAVEVETQPADRTLVNFATIFYAEPTTVTRTLTLLGQSVEVEATPSSFTWDYGDGDAETTDSPGAPYPAGTLTHSYADAGVTVDPTVDVTYSARFRVEVGDWQTIDDTVTIDGPTSPLRISEATAVLSGQY